MVVDEPPGPTWTILMLLAHFLNRRMDQQEGAIMSARLIAVLFLICFMAVQAQAGVLPNPIIFVKQTKVNHSGGTIQDLIGNFQGKQAALDQPVGGGLFLLTPTGDLRPVIAGASIAVRDPEISDDGQRVIFAMKKTPNGKWQIWDCAIDGTGLRKLSRSPEFNDFDPAYLPDGQILFLSDRRRVADPFLNYPSAQMHVMNLDGGKVKLLNANPGGQSNPIPSEFGAILFSEFDYHDRRLNIHEPLDPLAVNRFLPWLVYADGSGFDHPLFGTHTIADFKGGYTSVRVIPGTGKLLGVLANEANTFGAGSLVRMNYARNDDKESPHLLTADVSERKQNNPHGRWRDPYPMSDGSILASYADGPVYQSKAILNASEIPHFTIVRLSKEGKQQETIYEDPAFWCWQPVEVTSRPPLFIYPGFLTKKFKYAMINSLDVFNRGRNFRRVVNGDKQPDPVRGSIAEVRIYKTVRTQNGNPEFQQYSDQRLVELGKTPVFPDGSFAALVPIDTPLVWELLDRTGKVVVQERFGTTLKGGEIRSCYGCHAPHDGTIGNTINMAQPFATNLTPFDPDTDKNGVLDILENFIVFPGPLEGGGR